MTQVLEDVIAGKLKRVIFEMPPRHGKSELFSRRLPAAYLGRNPTGQVVHATYNGTLAKKEGRAVQRIMTSPAFKALYPEVALPSETKQSLAGARWVRKTEYFETIGHGGFYMATGIGGTLTGTGMTLGIIDDPIKDPKEADSETIRENIWDWYQSTFLTRDEGDAALVIGMTRWHEDDLVGRILAQEAEAIENGEPTEGWVVIRFEALREDMSEPAAGMPAYIRDPRPLGGALWPGKFDEEKLAKIKGRYRKSGLRWWNALYQQHPTSTEGEILKREYWGYATAAQVKEGMLCRIQSADTAFSKKKTNARSVIGTFAIMKGGMACLIDVAKGWWAFPDLKRQATAQYNKHAPYRVLIEDKASGKDLIPELAETLPRGVLVPWEPEGGDKIARAHAITGMIEAPASTERNPKRVVLLEGAPWLKEFIDETAAFPTGKLADQVDMFTQFCAWYRKEWREPTERVLVNRKHARRYED